MKRIAIALLLTSAAPAQIDPCVGLFRHTEGGLTWWEWHYYYVRVAMWSHVELVPTAEGIGLLCVFRGVDRTDPTAWVPRVATIPDLGVCPPGNNVLLTRAWWFDERPRPGELITRCGQVIGSLERMPTGTSGGSRMGYCQYLGSRHDMLITSSTIQDWHRMPSYWAVLLHPERGWW